MKNDVKPTAGQRAVYDTLAMMRGAVYVHVLEEKLRKIGYNLSRSEIKTDLRELKKAGLIESYSAPVTAMMRSRPHVWQVIDRG